MNGAAPPSRPPPGRKLSPAATRSARTEFSWRVLVVLGLLTLFVFLAVLVVFSIDILLLIFAGVLVGIYLRWLKAHVAALTRLPQGIALALVMVLLVFLAGLSLTLLAPVVERQADTIAQEIPRSIEKFRSYLLHFSWGDEVADSAKNPEKLIPGKNGSDWSGLIGPLVGIFSTTFGVVGGIVLVVVIGIYVAAETDTYFEGLLKLIPMRRRPRAREVLLQLGHTLRWWLPGQSLSMLILGVSVFAFLQFLEIPGAIVLALFTAISTFIPNLGPIIAYVPTALIALTVSPRHLLYVTLFYVVIQNVEGFLVTPLVHRKGIAVPPVLIVSVQILLFTLIGFMGVLLAMPILAITIVMVKMIYIEGILGDRHGSQEAGSDPDGS